MAGHVLLVEDEPSVGELVRGYLARDGWTVIWVRSGEEALVELDRHPVRIVILDIGLPGMDGFEVCRDDARPLAGADPDADRARRGARPGRRPRGRRRRLPHEAVLAARARRADEGDPAPLRAADRLTTCSSSATSSLNRETHDVTIAGQRGRADREGVRPARLLPGEPGRGALARRPARPRVGRRPIPAARAPSTSMSRSSAASSAGPS